MTTKHPVATTADLMKLFGYLKTRDLPITVAVRDGVDRTNAQNNLVHKWFKEISVQSGDESDLDVKAHCNLIYGVPIMSQDEEWAAAFGYIFQALNYKAKKKAIKVLDIPFTRRMKTGELYDYMTEMARDYQEAGFILTHPDDRKYADMER